MRAPATPAPTGDDIACIVFEEGLRLGVNARGGTVMERREVPFIVRDGTRAVSMGDSAVTVRLEPNEQGGRVLTLTSESGGRIVRSSYDFGEQRSAAHLPMGIGFTGEQRTFGLEQGGGMQFACGTFNGVKRDEVILALLDAAPGPGVPRPARVVCRLGLFDGIRSTNRVVRQVVARAMSDRVGQG